MAPAPARVDPRVARTRQLLLHAFTELLGERSFRSLTVQDIADRATVNRATFYAHFADKYSLMDTLVREGFREVLARALPTGDDFDRANLRALVRAVCEFLAQVQAQQCRPGDHAQLEPLLETAVPQELRTFLAAWLRRPPAILPSATVEIAATMMSWAIFGAGNAWSRDPRNVSPDILADQVVAILTEGVMPLARIGRHPA